jgi:hypothetical protein
MPPNYDICARFATLVQGAIWKGPGTIGDDPAF